MANADKHRIKQTDTKTCKRVWLCSSLVECDCGLRSGNLKYANKQTATREQTPRQAVQLHDNFGKGIN
eukprot:3098119-Lingulodinium_polyedra.AAC.1